MIKQLLGLVILLTFLATPAHSQVLPFGRGGSGSGGEGGTHEASTHYPGNSADISSVYATRAYADAIASGLNPKHIAFVATTANITLSGEQTIDGELTSASRVLVWFQTDKSENGVYLTGAGAWTRTTDADTADEVAEMFIFVQAGTVNHDTGFILITDPPITLGTTDLEYDIFTTPLDITASGGLEKVGNDISISTGGVNSTKILDETIVAADVHPNAALLKTQIEDTGEWEVSEVPGLPASKITSGELAVERGGTGAANTPTTGRYLKGDGTDFVTSTGDASGTGACTNEVVTGLNSDAPPTCDPVTGTMIQDNTITNPKLSATLDLPKTKIADTNTWEVSEIPDLPPTKIVGPGTFASALLPIATSTAPGALFGDTLCAPGTVQRGRNADGTINCITDETGESATEIVIEQTRDPVQGDACELSHKWINQSADPPRWWLPVSCEVGLERWEPTTSEALRDVPGGVLGINEETEKVDGTFLPWPEQFATVVQPGSCTSYQHTWIDTTQTEAWRECKCPGGPGSNPVCRPFVGKIDMVCVDGVDCRVVEEGRDGVLNIIPGPGMLASIGQVGDVIEVILESADPTTTTWQEQFDGGNRTFGNLTPASPLVMVGTDPDGARCTWYESSGDFFRDCTQADGTPSSHVNEIGVDRKWALRTPTVQDTIKVDYAEPEVLDLKERTTDPAAPVTGRGKIYIKNDELYARTDTGVKGPFGAGGGTIYPIRPYSTIPVTAASTFAWVHDTGAGAGARRVEGMGVAASLAADADWELRFQLPTTIPTTCTHKLRLKGITSGTSQNAIVNPLWGRVTAEQDPSAQTHTGEGDTTVTFNATAHQYEVTDITLDAHTLVDGDEISMILRFESTSWTLAQISTWNAWVICN